MRKATPINKLATNQSAMEAALLRAARKVEHSPEYDRVLFLLTPDDQLTPAVIENAARAEQLLGV